MMKSILMLVLALFSVSTFAFSDPQNAYKLYTEGKAVIVDVREKDEVNEGMVKGAQWFALSKTTSEKNWKENFQKMIGNKKIYLYCRSGNRSGKMETLLKENGIASENIGGFQMLKAILPTSVNN